MKKTRIVLILISLIAVATKLAARDYNILNYGAQSDTSLLSTQALQQAIDECSQAGGVFIEKSDFLLHSGLQLIERGPLTSGRAICFIQSSYLNANLIKKHSHRLVQIRFDKIFGHSVAQSS